MLHLALVEHNRPVRGIVPNRRRDKETSGQLCIDEHFVCAIKVFGKFAFHTLFGRAVGKDIVLNGFLCRIGFIHCQAVFFRREDAAVVAALNGIIGDMLHDHGSFLLLDQPDHLCDKFFWVVLVHRKGCRLDALQNPCNGMPGQRCPLCNFTDQIIRNLPVMCIPQRICFVLCVVEAAAFPHHIGTQNIFLTSIGDGILQPADVQLAVDVYDCFLNQFLRIKIHRIGVFVVDCLPKLLELSFFKPVVQRIF